MCNESSVFSPRNFFRAGMQLERRYSGIRRRFAMVKIRTYFGAEEQVGNQHEEQAMNDYLAYRRKADYYMKGDPGQRQPPCPVSTEEHEDPAHNRQQTDEGDPNELQFKRLRYFEVSEVISKAEGPGRDEKPTDDQDGNRT